MTETQTIIDYREGLTVQDLDFTNGTVVVRYPTTLLSITPNENATYSVSLSERADKPFTVNPMGSGIVAEISLAGALKYERHANNRDGFSQHMKTLKASDANICLSTASTWLVNNEEWAANATYDDAHRENELRGRKNGNGSKPLPQVDASSLSPDPASRIQPSSQDRAPGQ